jgi:hypothetical protein
MICLWFALKLAYIPKEESEAISSLSHFLFAIGSEDIQSRSLAD